LAPRPPELPVARATRVLPPPGPRPRLPGLHRLPPAHHRLPLLPGQPRRLAEPPAGGRPPGPAAPPAVLPVQRRLPAEVTRGPPPLRRGGRFRSTTALSPILRSRRRNPV